MALFGEHNETRQGWGGTFHQLPDLRCERMT
jgi:hypothetical protein